MNTDEPNYGEEYLRAKYKNFWMRAAIKTLTEQAILNGTAGPDPDYLKIIVGDNIIEQQSIPNTSNPGDFTTTVYYTPPLKYRKFEISKLKECPKCQVVFLLVVPESIENIELRKWPGLYRFRKATEDEVNRNFTYIPLEEHECNEMSF